jgi:hypothetical protein
MTTVEKAAARYADLPGLRIGQLLPVPKLT